MEPETPKFELDFSPYVILGLLAMCGYLAYVLAQRNKEWKYQDRIFREQIKAMGDRHFDPVAHTANGKVPATVMTETADNAPESL